MVDKVTLLAADRHRLGPGGKRKAARQRQPMAALRTDPGDRLQPGLPAARTSCSRHLLQPGPP